MGNRIRKDLQEKKEASIKMLKGSKDERVIAFVYAFLKLQEEKENK